MTDVNVSGPACVVSDLAAVNCQVSAVKDTDTTRFTVSVWTVSGLPLGDFATVHHHCGAVGQRYVRRTELGVVFAVVIGNRATVEGERGVLTLDGDCASIGATHFSRTRNASGIHDEFAVHGNGRSERATSHHIVVFGTRVNGYAVAICSAIGKGELAAFLNSDEAACEVTVFANKAAVRSPGGDCRVYQLDICACWNHQSFCQQGIRGIADFDTCGRSSRLVDEFL